MIEALDKKSTVNAIGYMNRYRASVLRARELLTSRAILGASGYWMNAVYKVPWWSKTDDSGGSVNEQTTHLVDTARFLLGEVEGVSARFSPHHEIADLTGNAAITLHHAAGRLTSLLYSCRAEVKMIAFRTFTASGEIALEDWDFRLRDPESGMLSDRDEDRNAIFTRETAAFLDAIARNDSEAILCDAHEALRTQHVLDAIHRAASTGQTIVL